MNKKALFVICCFIGFCLILSGLKFVMVPIRVSEDIPSDLNGNGVVDYPDFTIWGNAFGATPTSPNWNEKADLNKDKRINAFDSNIIVRNFGNEYLQWISLLTILNQVIQDNPFVALSIGLFVSFLLFLLKGRKLVITTKVYVRYYILRLLRRYIHISM